MAPEPEDGLETAAGSAAVGPRAPLLVAREARLDQEGVPLVEHLTAEVRGGRLGLVGNWQAFFGVLRGRVQLAAGELTVLGSPADEVVSRGVAGLVSSDEGLPPAWTVREYLEFSAGLQGQSRRHAREEVLSVTGELGLQPLLARRLGQLLLAERRAADLARALLGSPVALVVDSPFAGLDAPGQDYWGALLWRASSGRELILGVPSLSPTELERSWLRSLDETLVLVSGALVAQGKADEVLEVRSRYRLTVARHGHALAERLSTAGYRVFVAAPSGLLSRYATPAGAAGAVVRLVVELGQAGELGALLDHSLAAGAPLLELEPL